ncbi:MAG TPA: SAM-dependent methyltransferase [Stellaceae bacterium]|jgi:SAM-dependent methyltransferase|nr:SAM-dependent methyltransferase [Stellaceae bacterium]
MSLLDQFVVPRLRRYWVRMALRRVHYADRADKLNRLYCVEDPWRMDSAREQARFAWTNELIATHLSPLDSVLEVGCAEGHQSQYLSRVCRQLYGVDVSRRAVRRAERRCPAGTFAVADPLGVWPVQMPVKVDLVTACEVLYYVTDIAPFLARLSELGRTCLVTYYQGQAPALDPQFAAMSHCRRDRFCFDGMEWHAVWWPTDGSQGS